MRTKQFKKIIEVDASDWTSSCDLYKAILPKLGAPAWHGDSVNALTESMVWGEINALEPPYTLRILGAAKLSADLVEELNWLKEGVQEARADMRSREGQDVDVDVEIIG